MAWFGLIDMISILPHARIIFGYLFRLASFDVKIIDNPLQTLYFVEVAIGQLELLFIFPLIVTLSHQ
jgi:hypothetical protein